MEWLRGLQPWMRPRKQRVIDELERFRIEMRCSSEEFTLHIAGSAWALRNTLGTSYNMDSMQYPKSPEPERIKRLYEQRKQIASSMGVEYPHLPADCNTFEGLCGFIFGVESRYGSPDPSGSKRRLEEILQSDYDELAT